MLRHDINVGQIYVERTLYTNRPPSLRSAYSSPSKTRRTCRHCARGGAVGSGTALQTKVAGSISDVVIGVFHWHNLSGRIMGLGSTQPLTDKSTRRPVRRGDNPTTFMYRLSWNLGAAASWKPQGLSRPIQRLLYLFYTPTQISEKFRCFSQHCEKRHSSSCLSVRPSVCSHARLQLGGFSWNLIFEDFFKNPSSKFKFH